MSDAATLGIRSMDLGTTAKGDGLARDARAARTIGRYDRDALVKAALAHGGDGGRDAWRHDAIARAGEQSVDIRITPAAMT